MGGSNDYNFGKDGAEDPPNNLQIICPACNALKTQLESFAGQPKFVYIIFVYNIMNHDMKSAYYFLENLVPRKVIFARSLFNVGSTSTMKRSASVMPSSSTKKHKGDRKKEEDPCGGHRRLPGQVG